jgi:putative SOS response-associated peptidase YedK
MCGRYATTRSDADLALLFDAVDVTEDAVDVTERADVTESLTPGSHAPGSHAPGSPAPGGPASSSLAPSWNVAPTDPVPLIRVSRSRDARVLDTARWGLVPPWATDLRGGARMINARAETVATSPAFASSFARRRCLVPADGWYEWVRDGKRKQAFYLTPADGSVLAFAGIWSAWGPESVLTCSVLTTAALGGLARVHDRMPLILPADRWAPWLAGGGDGAELLRPMTPAELESIEVRAVGPAVGDVRNNGPELVAPAEREQPAATLF